jgi:two-component system, NarL family, nitrate/nitrite response regulator NarL
VSKGSSKRVGSNPLQAPRRAAPRRPQRPIRLFLLIEYAIRRDGLRLLFATEPDFRVFGSAANWAGAVRACRSDVVVVDLSHPRVPDATSLRALTTICAPARVIVLTSALDLSQIGEALRLGVRGIVAQNITAALLFKCVRAVAAGEYWVEGDIIAGLPQRLSETTSPNAPRRNAFGLTGRELQVVSLLIAGHGNKAIADKCGIRERTVKQHLTNMFDKVGVSNRLGLAPFALRKQLVVPDGAGRPEPRRVRG